MWVTVTSAAATLAATAGAIAAGRSTDDETLRESGVFLLDRDGPVAVHDERHL